jgi:pyruvate formate lyase activating enzyme
MFETKIPSKSIFSGIQPFTTIDDEGYLGAILFTGGCNFRCIYCHNPDFVIPEKVKFLPLQEIITFLKKRKGLIESIIICGGEPTIHPNLIDWIKYIKSLGYRIKLDTNATNSIMFKKIIDENLIDFIAIDFKAELNNYKKVINVNFNQDLIIQNIKYLIKSNINYEIRTTIHSKIHTENEIYKIINKMKKIGVKNYYLQLFKMPPETVGNIKEESNYDKNILDKINSKLKESFEKTGIRNID